MAVTTWTNHHEVTVRADIESVLSWWTSQQRREDRRAHFESLGGQGFSYQETAEADTQLTETNWTTAEGLFVSLRVETSNAPDGKVERSAEGAAILRSRTSQQRRWPDGREDKSGTSTVTEFRRAQPATTQVRLTTTRHKEGAWWWERYLPPIGERSQQRRHLQRMVGQCEHDLGSS